MTEQRTRKVRPGFDPDEKPDAAQPTSKAEELKAEMQMTDGLKAETKALEAKRDQLEQEVQQLAEERVEFGEDWEIGKQSWQPRCPKCSDRETTVLCFSYHARGPISYYECRAPGCTYKTKQTRPLRRRQPKDETPQQSVAARPDMKEVG